MKGIFTKYLSYLTLRGHMNQVVLFFFSKTSNTKLSIPKMLFSDKLYPDAIIGMFFYSEVAQVVDGTVSTRSA